MILATLALWSHAAAAILFGALAAWQAARRGDAAGRRTLAIALAVTAGWVLLVLARGPHDLAARLAEGARDLAWLGFMLALLRRAGAAGREAGGGRAPGRVVFILYATVAAIVVARGAVDTAARFAPADAALVAAAFDVAMLLRMMTAIGALMLVHNLYGAAAPQARWAIRPPMIALATMWVYDLNLHTLAYLGDAWPPALVALRGVLMAALAPLFAWGSRRNADVPMRLSRGAAFRSLSLLAIGAYLVAMALIARVVQAVGGDYARVATIAIVAVMSLAALLVLPSRRARAWLRAALTRHLFEHRYDYRAEWLRFTGTLGHPGEDAAPLDVRAVKAIADITGSPGGLLLLPGEDGGLLAAARWDWPTADTPFHAADAAFARRIEADGRIVAFDDWRGRAGGPAGDPPPAWLVAEAAAWAAVPLLHIDRLVGVVILARPWPDRTLDWEDFALLRVAGRQVASYLAEARSLEALAEARRFDEFNRRFAFVIHDIKNLVSQLGLLTRNAERHADNPAFRVDMIETLRSSNARMNDLLARLSQHHGGRVEAPRPTALGAIADAVAAARRALHPIEVSGRRDILAAADAARLEQALGHLVQNAIEASAPAQPVRIGLGRRGREATIEVVDRGHGMSAEFIRTGLFKPFASTRAGGFGVGAFEARTIVAAMGGRLEVESREGEGSRFTILLPLAEPAAAPAAAPIEAAA